MAMMKISELKAHTRDILRKCWAEIAFICLINSGIGLTDFVLMWLIGRFSGTIMAFSFLPVFISFPPVFFIGSAIVLLITYILTAPLYFGTKWYCWQAACGNIMPVSAILAGYSSADNFKRHIKLRIQLDMRKLLIILPAAAVGGIEILLASKLKEYYADVANSEMFINIGCAVMLAGLAVLCFVFGMDNTLTGYIAAARTEADAKTIVRESRKITKHRVPYMLALYLSFYNWYVFCLAIFPLLFIVPYVDMTTAVMIKAVMDDNEDMSGSDGKETDEKTEKENSLAVQIQNA